MSRPPFSAGRESVSPAVASNEKDAETMPTQEVFKAFDGPVAVPSRSR
jgi:hypothetical protein